MTKQEAIRVAIECLDDVKASVIKNKNMLEKVNAEKVFMDKLNNRIDEINDTIEHLLNIEIEEL